MKPEFMRLRRALASTLAALLMAVGIVVLSPALSASAHNYTVKASCDAGLSVNLSSYPKKNTTVKVVIDGATKADTTFGGHGRDAHWSKTFSWDSTQDHSYKVTVYSPDDPDGYEDWSFTESGDVKACKVPDKPAISVTGSTCATPSKGNGTVAFTLTGVTGAYTVKLLEGTEVKKTVTNSGGAGSFSNVPPGTYTVKASAGGLSATAGPVTVDLCSTVSPDVQLTIEPCVAGGTLGAITANLSKLTIGSTYTVKLYTSADALLETLPLTATATTHSLSFAGHGPGGYYVTISDEAGGLLTTSADATILDCTPELTVTVLLEPCVALQTGNDRELVVTVDGMAAATVYTIQLVTADAAATEIATVSTPGGSATSFGHTFTGVPTGDYKVLVLNGSDTLESSTVTATVCILPDLAPPSIELLADQCDGSGDGINVLTARMIDLDPTKTYYVRVVDSAGVTALGGDDQTVTGSTTATVEFPGVTTTGTYSAQLLIDPGKQLAATSPASVDFSVCLPTLAMTGPGVLVPLGSVAALLLTLGGAVVTGRLRRRMAL